MIYDCEIYVHIPFCIRKCNYCDFLSFPCGEKSWRLYTDALISEIKSWGKNMDLKNIVDSDINNVSSVFIGGGTPSILPANYIGQILEALRECFDIDEDAEITIEANPGTLDYDKLKLYKSKGINRLSIGLQSANNNELRLLGRIHTYEQFEENYKRAREAGFENINIDLMSGLPGQNLKNFEETLRKVTLLKPEHISAYGLIIEPGTEIWKHYGDDEHSCKNMDEKWPPLPKEEEEREMYYLTRELLASYGYHQYEISNYALNGNLRGNPVEAFECRHNKGYWERRDYIGFGLGSASMVGNVRWKNTDDMEKYLTSVSEGISGWITDIDKLSIEDEMSEALFLGLRETKGVNINKFVNDFKKRPEDVSGEWREHIEKMLSLKLVEYVAGESEYLRLTLKGMDLANVVMSGFV